jgi:hypothetical protein
MGYSQKSKYGSRKVTVDGVTYDSVKEYRRFKELSLLERAGTIQNLQRQVKYVLIPAQREYCDDIYTRGRNKGCFKPGKLIERECSYIADFVYIQNGEIVVEDTKGFRTKDYIIKRKLMLWNYGIQIKEV